MLPLNRELATSFSSQVAVDFLLFEIVFFFRYPAAPTWTKFTKYRGNNMIKYEALISPGIYQENNTMDSQIKCPNRQWVTDQKLLQQ